MVTRSTCVACRGEDLRNLCTTPPIPAFQGCTDKSDHDDISAPMRWVYCAACGTSMLSESLPLELIYMDGHAASLGGVWDEHHKNLASFVSKHRSAGVMEVGGGVGKLAKFFRRNDKQTPWTILEPNPVEIATDSTDVSYIDGFLDADFTIPDDVGTVVFSHSLEHIYDLAGILETLSDKLSPSDRVVIAWPQLEHWLKEGLPGALNWEHSYYVPIDVLLALMSSKGLELIDRYNFGFNHSYFLAFRKGFSTPFTPDTSRVEERRDIVIGYWNGFSKRVRRLNELIGSSKRPLFLSPASVYSQYLISFGLNLDRLSAVLDNSEAKQGKRLYGTTAKVASPGVISGLDCDVILNGGAHTKEMISQFSQLAPSGQFLDARNF